MEDTSIVSLFLARDETALMQTSKKYGKQLRLLSANIVKDIETAEECENDTYMEVWNTIPPHEPHEYLYPYLARIIRNISLNCCRKRSRLKRAAFICELSSELEECIPSPNDCECQIDAILLRDLINTFLGTLDSEVRNVFLRRYWYLDSIADISKRYAFSQSKVKTTLFRARNQLKDYLNKEGYSL